MTDNLVYNNKYQPLEAQQAGLRELYKQQTVKNRIIAKGWQKLAEEKEKLAEQYVEFNQRVSEFIQEKQRFEIWKEQKEKEIDTAIRNIGNNDILG